MRISGSYPFKTDPAPPFTLRALSLGAGVQSSRILLGVLEGEFGKWGVTAPEVAVFADTGDEPQPVYDWLTYLQERCEAVGFPLHTVSEGSIVADAYSTATTREGGQTGRFASMPLHTFNQADEPMMMRRQCTHQYKIRPLRRKLREVIADLRVLSDEDAKQMDLFGHSVLGIELGAAGLQDDCSGTCGV